MSKVNSNNYEAMVIIDPRLAEEQRVELIAKLTKVLTDGGAEIKETCHWGMRRLAYAIEKRNEGYYVIFYFTLATVGETLNNLERQCRFDENVMRYMLLNVPTRRRGNEVAQLVPTTGWLSDFRFDDLSQKRAAAQNMSAFQSSRGRGGEGDGRGSEGEGRGDEERSEEESSREVPAIEEE